VSLTWTPPIWDGASTITDYVIEKCIDGTNWIPCTDAVSTLASATITGLTNNQTLTFHVAAVNAIGRGAYSTPSPPVTPIAPATIPGAPTGLVATAGDTTASLVWTAPASDGGRTISQYTIQKSTDSGATWVPYANTGSTLTNATVTGLTNGVPVIFQVGAINNIGSGQWSASSTSVTPAAAAVHPTIRGKASAVGSPVSQIPYANWDVAPVAGDKLVAFLDFYAQGLWDPLGETAYVGGITGVVGWTQEAIAGDGGVSPGDRVTYVYKRTADGTTNDRIAWGGETAKCVAHMVAVKDSATGVISAFATNNNTSAAMTTVNLPTAPAPQVNDLVLTHFAIGHDTETTGGSFTPPTGMTEVLDTSQGSLYACTDSETFVSGTIRQATMASSSGNQIQLMSSVVIR
jgi:titin